MRLLRSLRSLAMTIPLACSLVFAEQRPQEDSIKDIRRRFEFGAFGHHVSHTIFSLGGFVSAAFLDPNIPAYFGGRVKVDHWSKPITLSEDPDFQRNNLNVWSFGAFTGFERHRHTLEGELMGQGFSRMFGPMVGIAYQYRMAGPLHFFSHGSLGFFRRDTLADTEGGLELRWGRGFSVRLGYRLLTSKINYRAGPIAGIVIRFTQAAPL